MPASIPEIYCFTFNPFEENTYVIANGGSCVIIDPGCYTENEKRELELFISEKSLKPEKVILTHAHIDHILGNNFVCARFNIPIMMNSIEVPLLKAASSYGEMWGINVEPSPESTEFLNEGDTFKVGESVFNVIFTPGHSPGSLSFFNTESSILIAGDVLFNQSIGRTDLPGGNHETLIKSIKEKLLPLGDDVKVYPGHGPETTIGFEKKFNPFL